ncbi:hypothetical protein F0L74_03080 [Chitinophaga agrisoli]|uniref:DUF4136 domain-containing protein n=1 Tax=Chitinophaga agrisoli TaxID=2607653 RepID=A0A5B2W2I6_9BACT|nr:hypothetical protein [Chitinophaga agrisoli]KAA2244960.1 hypothetical protein F0L74_03080 [Chitinophaga agrisoli]
MKKIGLFIMSAGLLLLAACSSTKLTSSWKTNDATLQRDKKIVVMALAPQRENQLRALMEDNLAAELKKEGFNAVSALREYGPDAFGDKTDEKTALRKLRNNNASQVLTVVLLNKARERDFVPGPMYGGYPYYYGGFWPYYSRWYGNMYQPGYYQSNTKYSWQSNLYDLDQRKLIYSAQTQSVDPPTAVRQAYLYAKQIVKDMTKQQLIAKN